VLRGPGGGGCSVADSSGRTTEALLDKYFQFFTHLTTLDSAGAVVVLAVSQARPEGLSLAVVPLVVFGLSLLAALSGMETVLTCLSHPDGTQARVAVLWRWRVGAGSYLRQALHFSILFFVGGWQRSPTPLLASNSPGRLVEISFY
jgi:hypothetical protein